ncbi:MAG TPA: DUF3604 domain-containing protein [Bryobacteraceae bacterium]|nr:DUF3604 domain-containing protein [Bryobacteraceae bacterium]
MNRPLTVLGAAMTGAVCCFVPIRRIPAQETPRDYLPAALRQQVNRLKRDTAPTTKANLVERGLILWDWINAYSLTGGPVPVNATQSVGGVFALRDDPSATAPPALSKNIDALIYEFRLKDERPKAIPTLRLDRAGPFPAGSWQTIQQTLTCGDEAMPAGSTLMLARMLMSDGGLAQVDDPAADHYVSARCSNPRVRLVKAKVPWSGMHGGFRASAENAAYRLEGDALQPGGTITLVFGDRSGGSRGFRMPGFSNDRFLLPVYADIKGDGCFLTLSWPAIAVQGKQVAAVKMFAPSIVKAGERFEAAVRSEDELWNRATGPLPAYRVELAGRTVREIPAGEDSVAVVQDLQIDQPGTYRFAVRSADGRISGESNPIWVEQNPPYRVYWGETHAHTGMAEGMGSVDGFYRWGREDARLDFLGLSEHDVYLDDSEWKSMQAAVRRYTEPGKFIAYLAYEWTVSRPSGGHHNVFFRSPSQSRVAANNAYTLSRLYQGLRAANKTSDVLIIPHAHQAGDWRRNDPDMERLVEIASMHGTFEWFGNYYLKSGFDVGFVAASDDHRTRPGYSGTMPAGALQQFGGLVAAKARDKGVNEIFDALRDRDTYAVSGAERILLEVDLNGARAGRRVAYTAGRRLRARVSGTGPLDRVEVIKNGELVFTRRFAEAPLRPRSRVGIGFQSSSEPFIRDNPRGYRRWRGSLTVRGARILDVRTHFDNRSSEYARRDSQSPDRILFSADTRGAINSLELELDGVTPSTAVGIALEESIEHDVAPPMVRPFARIPAAAYELPFSELKNGLLVRESALGRNLDSITLQLIEPNAPRDGEIDFQDRSAAGQGDYYYVRVTQLNGAHAWSSPIWVGGEATR